uniref:EF-hand domain-containing protein n=1 Tax=Alexandrium catenella TaxID=2925 RepID=A0A7S1S9V7_ALECA
MALESDYPEWPWWDLVNCLFLLAYVLEFAMRLLHRGPKQLLWSGKSRRWMAYDLFVIGLGVLDVAVSSLYVASSGVSAASFAGMPAELSGQPRAAEDAVEGLDLPAVRALAKRRLFDAPVSTGQFGIVRFLMLSRLLRIVRVLRIINPLYDCVRLLMDMMSTFIWILSIIFIFCFVLAIMLTRLLGHGLAVKTQDEELRKKVQSMFADIPTSLFTLFQLTTAEDWSLVAGPVVETFGMWRYFFMAFITFMSWTMLSLLTAVASETMISFSSYKKEEEKIYQEIQRHNFTTFLCAEFLRADTDGNHVLDKEEFTTLMSRPSMMEEMKSHGIHLADQDLVRTWDTFDIDDSGELSIDELVTGFAYLQESLAMKHVANVGYSLKRFSVRMETEIAHMEGDCMRLQEDERPVVERAMERASRSREQWSKFWSDASSEGRADGLPSAASCRKTGSNPASPGAGGQRQRNSMVWTWTRTGNSSASRTMNI